MIGDFGWGTRPERRVARLIKRWSRDVRVHGFATTGDNIYPSGHPDSFEAAWEEPYGWVDRRNLRMAASLGNHDYGTDNAKPVMDLLKMPSRWYKREFRHVDLFVLDSNRPWSESQRTWLRRKLGRSDARWQVALFHHPPYSCGEHGSEGSARKAFARILRRKGADVVLNGHDHSYQRFKRRRGVTYVVTGGGGAPLYDLDPCPDGLRLVKGNDRRYHYVRVVASRSNLRLKAIAPGGAVLDRYRVRS